MTIFQRIQHEGSLLSSAGNKPLSKLIRKKSMVSGFHIFQPTQKQHFFSSPNPTFLKAKPLRPLLTAWLSTLEVNSTAL
jgi:hypothetical protein